MSGLHDSLSTAKSLSAQQSFGLVLGLLLATISLVYRWKLSSSPITPQNTSVDKKIRKYGEWTPVAFTYPPVKASAREPAELEPIPYRPFRAGEYHVTMGIRSMPWDEWIELDNEFEKYFRIRENRIRTRAETVIKVLPDNPGVVSSGADAAIETVHEISEYLSQRFPATFSVERHSPDTHAPHPGWGGLSPVKSIKIKPLEVSYTLPLHVNDGENAAVRALEIASLLVQEDLALMIEGSDGKYYFQSGAITVAGFWRIGDKIGLPLDEIHTTGSVPRYKEKLQTSMERFFRRLAVDKPVARNNYFFQVVKPPAPEGVEDLDPEELAWAESSHGPEDDFLGTHPAEQPTRPIPTPSNIRLRSERQTLRRLPRTGAILFGIRTYLTPIEQLAQEPGVARRLAGALRGWGEDIGEYKGKNGGGWWDVVLDYLDKKVDEKGEIGADDDIKRMDNYPY
ncbi:hypothetical protein C0991_012370 [Blastosporella zonata]|nr:hypothetical protein C0991_012370 [Blastosporella zonata]